MLLKLLVLPELSVVLQHGLVDLVPYEGYFADFLLFRLCCLR